MTEATPPYSIEQLLHGELRVVNVGVTLFAEQLVDQGIPVVQVDWRPPAGGDERLVGLLERLT